MESYFVRAVEAADEKEALEILRDGLNHYAEIVKRLWNGVPQKDKDLLLLSMENVSTAIRKTWPEEGVMADMLGAIFNSTIIIESVPRKENEK